MIAKRALAISIVLVLCFLSLSVVSAADSSNNDDGINYDASISVSDVDISSSDIDMNDKLVSVSDNSNITKLNAANSPSNVEESKVNALTYNRNLYVGNNTRTGDGSYDNPYQTLQLALNAANNDCIIIKGGTYSGSGFTNLNIGNSNIAIIGEQGKRNN